MSNKALKSQIAIKLLMLTQDTGLPAWRCPWFFTNLDRGWGSTSCYRDVNAIMTSLSRVVDCQKVLDSLLSSYKNHPEVAYVDLDETLYQADSALYKVDSDKILIPNPSQFLSVSEFASTLAHELAHSTGHMSRLNRFTSFSNDKDYAKEELIAEFTSVMVLAHLGIEEMPTLKNSAAYLKPWLPFLSDEPDVLFDIIASAMKACSMIIGESDSNPSEENDSVKTD